MLGEEGTFLGHRAFVAEHMLPHYGLRPQVRAPLGPEYFMDILNGKIVMTEHWRREPIAFFVGGLYPTVNEMLVMW